MKLTVLAKPGSREAKVEKVDESTYKVFVKEPPVKGLANRAIVNLLADHLGVAPSAVSIISGHTGRIKTIEVK